MVRTLYHVLEVLTLVSKRIDCVFLLGPPIPANQQQLPPAMAPLAHLPQVDLNLERRLRGDEVQLLSDALNTIFNPPRNQPQGVARDVNDAMVARHLNARALARGPLVQLVNQPAVNAAQVPVVPGDQARAAAALAALPAGRSSPSYGLWSTRWSSSTPIQ